MKKLCMLLFSIVIGWACSIDQNYLDCLTKYVTSKPFKVNGVFYQYDFNHDGVLQRSDWIYIDLSNYKIYQLLGNPPSPNDAFGWKEIANIPQDLDLDNVSGFFIYLGFPLDPQTNFSWIYMALTPNNVYLFKLIGSSPQGDFVYLDLNCDGWGDPLPDIVLTSFDVPNQNQSSSLLPLPGTQTQSNNSNDIMATFAYTGNYSLQCNMGGGLSSSGGMGFSSSSSTWSSGGTSSSQSNGQSQSGKHFSGTKKASGLLSTRDEGVVSLTNGAQILISSGTIPPKSDGAPGEMVISIEKVSSLPSNAPALPQHLHIAGPIYQLGPEGFHFNFPPTLSLPVPQDVDMDKVVGIITWDQEHNRWKLVASSLDMAKRKVVASIRHFSYYTLGTWDMFGWNDWDQKVGKITVRGADTFWTGIGHVFSQYLPIKISYGVCIEAYNLEDPNEANAWYFTSKEGVYMDRPAYNGLVDPNGKKYRLPAGTYRFIEFFTRAEFNNYDPDYIPKFDLYWCDIPRTIKVSKGRDTIVAASSGAVNSYTTPTDELANESHGCWHRETSFNIPPCYAPHQDTSVGVGKLQFTLTWHKHVDLDLHVVDPRGEEIYYAHTSARSGGKLDRDNKCSNFEMGRPENIYWANSPLHGDYQVSVVYYANCGNSTPSGVDWTLRIAVNGQLYKTLTGTVHSVGEKQHIITFQW